MIKTSLGNLFLALIFAAFSNISFAQNPQSKSSDNSIKYPIVEGSNTQIPVTESVDQNQIKPTADSPNKSALKKLETVSKTLESSSLVDNIQGGMASLLLGNKATSLMFDDKEIDNIDRAIDSLRNNQVYSPEDGAPIFDALLDKKNKEAEAAREKAKQDEFNEKSYIYLASIMYSTPQDWVVWINDKKITSETNKKNKELYLKSVQKDQVSILWSVSASKLQVLLGKKADDLKLKLNENNQIEVRFVLQPNQTYILGSNSVVEGKAVVSMIKRKEPEAAPNPVPAQ